MFQDTGSDVGGRYPQRKSGMRLITQRSQVQILPPLQVKSQVSNLEPFGLAVAREDSAGNLRVRGPFSLRGGRASGVRDRTVTANAATGRGWMWVDSGVPSGPSEAVWSRMSLPAFDGAKKMAAPAAATGSRSPVSAVVPRFRPQRTPRARTYPALTGTAVRTTDGPMLVLVWVNVRPGGLTQGAMAARRVASRPAFKRVWPSSVGYVNAERTLTPCCHHSGAKWACHSQTIPWRSSLESRCRARIRSARAASRHRTRSRADSSTWVGTRTATISSRRSNRARCRASRASVLTLSP